MSAVPAASQVVGRRAVRVPGSRGPSGAAGGGDRCRSVCLYTPSADASGMGQHMLDLTAEYVADLDVTFLAWPTLPGQRLLARAAALGARAIATPHPRDPGFAGMIVETLQAWPADVFHGHVGTGREDFDGSRAARRAGVPAVVQTQHLPWVLRHTGKQRPFFHSIAAVDRLVAVSQAQRATYEAIGVPPQLFTTVPNGIPPRGPGPGRAAARRELGLDPDARVVMTVGRLIRMKGQRHLVAAVPELAARFPDLVVVVVGAGHLDGELRAQSAALGVADRVLLPGHRADARRLLDAADVFALPSVLEGMPLAAMEAMDAGLPVVATRAIGTAEVVADGETGLLVPLRDAGALAAALGRLLADPGLRARYGSAGRRRYLDCFTSARMAAQTRAVYEDVLRTARSVA